MSESVEKYGYLGGWDYRVVRTSGVVNGVPWTNLSIHDVYYDKKGNPAGCTKNAITVVTDESIDDLREQLYMMARAFDKPILDYAYFEERAKQKG
jgi:hypothetical protein